MLCSHAPFYSAEKTYHEQVTEITILSVSLLHDGQARSPPQKEHTVLTVMMDNGALYELYQLLAQFFTSMRAPLRDDGALNVDVTESHTHLAPYPRSHRLLRLCANHFS